MSRKGETVIRWSVVYDGCDVDGGHLTEEDARRQIPAIAESSNWDPESMTVVSRETDV